MSIYTEKNFVGSGKVVNGAQAYAYVEDSSGTPTIADSYNVSSITDRGVGIYTVNFTSALASADYSVGNFATNNGGGATGMLVYEQGTVARTASALPVRVSTASDVATDTEWSIIVFGG